MMPNFGDDEISRIQLSAKNRGIPLLMGIINATPDSFHHESRNGSVEDGIRFFEQGATWVDVGGESTRPGADEISIQEEIERVIPIITELTKHGLVSIDTRHHQVARKAIEAGALMINDISGLRDPNMLDLIVEKKVAVCIMHMLGDPKNMQSNPKYDNCSLEVSTQLNKKALELIEKGHPPDLICLDPGIGFGKKLEHNIELLQNHQMFRGDFDFPIMWGFSRKSIINDLCNQPLTKNRLPGTLAISAYAQFSGIDILRVHDIWEHRDFTKVIAALSQ